MAIEMYYTQSAQKFPKPEILQSGKFFRIIASTFRRTLANAHGVDMSRERLACRVVFPKRNNHNFWPLFPSFPMLAEIQALLHTICVWTQVRKIKRKSIMHDSDWFKTQYAFDFSDLQSNANFMQRGHSVLHHCTLFGFRVPCWIFMY